MRTIKFRIWDNINNKMYNLGNLEDCLYRTEFEEEFGYDLTNYIIMQYTGLKDKNGKEICEGDIIKSGFIGEVYWEGAGFYIKFFNREIDDYIYCSLGYFKNNIHPKEIEVIGNIYENPEFINK